MSPFYFHRKYNRYLKNESGIRQWQSIISDSCLWIKKNIQDLICMKTKLKLKYEQINIAITKVLAATPHKAPTVRPPAPHHENYSS